MTDSALTAPAETSPAKAVRTAAKPEIDYFISRRGTSTEAAQEVADVLTGAGYSVIVQDYHIAHGANFIAAMHDALKKCRHFIALLSEDYDDAPFTGAEWTNFYSISAQSGGLESAKSATLNVPATLTSTSMRPNTSFT